MLPAAVLSVIVEVQRVNEARGALSSVNSDLVKVDSTAKKVGSTMTTVGSRMERVGKTMTRYVAGPLLAVGAASGVMAAKFERSMNLIMTDAGGSVKEVKTLSGEVLKLGEHSEFGPQKLADSLFYIESAGIRGNKAIHMLDQTQRAAMAGNADLEHTVFGVVGAYNALGKEGGNVEHILATMNSVVGHGHLRLEELVQAMSTGLIGTAKTFGVSFEGMGSALAFFTRMSEPAQQAATRMRQTIVHLASESTNKAGEAMESIGMNFADMSEKIYHSHRLGPVIKELADHLQGLSEAEKNQVLTEAFGGGRFGTQIREAISNVHLLLKTEKEVAEKATVGRLRKSEMEQEKSAMVQLKILWSQVQVALIKLGNTLLPILVPIFQSIIHWVMGVSKWFDKLPQGTKHWIIVIGLLLIAVTGIVRVLGGFIKAMGEIILWFGKTETANAELVASNEMVAASYAEITASAEAALAARAEMEMMHGPYAGGIAADRAGLPVAEDLAPSMGMKVKGMLGAIGRGLTTGIPGMFAAYGIGNIITSVMSGDMQDAGAEGAGAMIGGLAAVLTGNPELAGIGVGIGSLLGELASHAFSGVFSEESSQEMLIKSHQAWMHNYRSQFRHATKQVENTADVVKETSASVRHAKKQDKKVNHEVAKAESHLTTIVEKYGVQSKQAAIALAELNREKHRGVVADQRLSDAEKVHGSVRKAQMNEDRNQVASAKEFIQRLQDDREKAVQNLQRIQRTMAPGPEKEAKESAWLKRFKTDSKELHEVSGKMWKTIKDAGNEIGPHFAHSLESINPSLYALKKASRETGESVAQHLGTLREGMHKIAPGVKTLGNVATAFDHTKTKAETLGSTMAGPFTSKTHGAFFTTAKNATNWREQVGSALSETQLEAVHMIEAWGGTAPTKATEGGKHKEAVKKARGGHLPGNRTGDRIPALLEDGEYIVNKEAVKKVGRHNLDRLNFGIAPRYAEGGAVQKAMAEASLLASEHIPYVWGGGHQAFSSSGGLDCSGAVSLVLHAAGLLGGAPLTSSGLESWGMPGPGPITVYANPSHAWMSIMGRPFGTSVNDSSHGLGFYGQPSAAYKAGFQVRHANVGAADLIGGVHALKERGLKGTGHLAKLGNEQIKGTTKALQEYITKHAPGEWGGGDFGEGGGGPAVEEMGKALMAHGANKVGAAGPIGNAWRESKWNPAAEGTGGGGLFGFTSGAISLASLKAAAGRAKIPWNDPKFQTEFMLRHGGQSLIPELNTAGSPEASAKLFMEQWERPGIPALGERESAARKAFNMGWQKGGLVDMVGETDRPALEAGGASPKTIHNSLLSGLRNYGNRKKLTHWDETWVDNWNKQQRDVRMYHRDYTWHFLEDHLPDLLWVTKPYNAVLEEHYGTAFSDKTDGAKKTGAGKATGAVKELAGTQAEIKKAIGQVRHGHTAKGYGGLRKAVRHLGKVEGLSPHMIQALVESSENVSTYSEYAQNAGGLNILEEEPPDAPEDWFAKTVFGQFHGHDEGYWLISELEALGALRNNLISAKQNIQGPQKMIQEMIKRFKHAMHVAEKRVRELKRREKEIEKEKEEIEAAEKLGTHKLEQEKNEWENKLHHLKQAKEPNKEPVHGEIKAAQAQIGTINTAIHDTQKKGSDGVQADQKKLVKVKEKLNAREKEVTAYTNFVPQLEEKRESMGETAQGLMSGYSLANGPHKGKAWEGLVEVQGRINNFKRSGPLPHEPEGMYGGNILSVQEAIKAYSSINTPPAKGKGTSATDDSTLQIKELEKEIETLNLQRELIRQVQGPIMESMPSVKTIAMPYAGPFATGGMVAATVGERGKEIAVMPTGTQMLSHYDAKDAVGGPTHLNFEHLEFHEADSRVAGRINGEEFEQEVPKITRKQAKRAAYGPTPGGTRRRG